jgi:Flp pilus assembly protein TadG
MKIGRTVRNNKGTTMVEFAIVASLFFLLILWIMDIGRYFFVQHTMQFATREGVRLALVGKTLADSSGKSMSRVASIVKTIQDGASTTLDPAKLGISIYPVKSDYSDPQGWQQQLNAGGPGDYMRVRTQYTFEFLTPMIGTFFPGGSIGVRAEATYRNELFDQ